VGGLRRSELHSSLLVLGEMFQHGGLVTTINGGVDGSVPLVRLMLQPDAETMLKIHGAVVTDASIPERIDTEVRSLISRLDSAQSCLDGAQSIGRFGIVLLLGGAGAFGMLQVEEVVWRVVIGAGLTLAPLLSRWTIRQAMHFALARVMR
jgi:hypothetical protein